ncbi:MAG: hypothetical protein ACJA0W_001712, partial [Candidatus Azotimanducaceae bacterium]
DAGRRQPIRRASELRQTLEQALAGAISLTAVKRRLTDVKRRLNGS